MKNTDPLMGAKLKYKTYLLNTFSDFFEPFFAHLASKFSKSANMAMLILNPLRKLFKNAPKNSYKLNKFDEHE